MCICSLPMGPVAGDAFTSMAWTSARTLTETPLTPMGHRNTRKPWCSFSMKSVTLGTQSVA